MNSPPAGPGTHRPAGIKTTGHERERRRPTPGPWQPGIPVLRIVGGDQEDTDRRAYPRFTLAT